MWGWCLDSLSEKKKNQSLLPTFEPWITALHDHLPYPQIRVTAPPWKIHRSYIFALHNKRNRWPGARLLHYVTVGNLRRPAVCFPPCNTPFHSLQRNPVQYQAFLLHHIHGACIRKPAGGGADAVWPEQNSTHLKHTIRLGWGDNAVLYQKYLCGSIDWPGAVTGSISPLAKPGCSCHILVESSLGKPNKPGRGEWR